MQVLVIDYGMGNLGSVRRAFEECGGTVRVSADPDSLGTAERIVLPGVGAFPDGMAQLRQAGWPAALREALTNPAVKLLGICLGMQLLADTGHEGGRTSGLGLIRGEVQPLEPDADDVRLPHVGWNEVSSCRTDPLMRNIADGTDFYFVHRYHLRPTDAGDLVALSPYCGGFAAVVGRANVYGVQFHPEKSSLAGFQLIRNFLSR